MRHGADTLMGDYERNVFLPDERAAQLNTCEYEKYWETICRNHASTDPKDSMHYISYSCALCFCRYPERKCKVKQP